MENKMREIFVGKVTLNIGVGEPGDKLEKVGRLLEQISGTKSVKTITKQRIPEWDIRPGLQIGVKSTIRGQKAEELLKRLLTAREDKLSKSNFDDKGNLSFGITEYVHIPGAKYDYTVGIVGLSVAVTLMRRGYGIKNRRNGGVVGRKHRITPEEAVKFMSDKFKVSIND